MLRAKKLPEFHWPRGGLFVGMNPRAVREARIEREAATLRNWLYGSLVAVAFVAVCGWIQAADDALAARERERRAHVIEANCRVPIRGEKLVVSPVAESKDVRYTCAIYTTWPMASREKSRTDIEVR